MIAIAGGTGNLGRALVPRLIDAGDEVRILARHPDRIPDAWLDRVEGHAIDARRPETIGAALAGVRTLVLAITGFGGPDAGGVHAVDGDGNLALIHAAEAAGVEHVILVSVAQAAPDHPIELFRAKFAAERRLRSSSVAWTIVQPTAYMETWVELLGRPLLTGDHARVIGSGHNPINFVSAADVAFVVDAAYRDPGSVDRRSWCRAHATSRSTTWCGEIAHVLGVEPAIDHAPRALIRLVAAGMSLRRPVLAGQLRTALVMDSRDMAVDAASLRARFPTLTSTALDTVIRRQLARTEPQPVLEAA